MRLDKELLKVLKKAGRPLSAAEAAQSAGVPEARASSTLDALVRSGSVTRTRDGRYLVLRQRGVLSGRISLTRRGYGFVGSPGGDVYVRRTDLAGAMHGDTVAVRLHSRGGREGLSGEVVQVLERAVTQVVGAYERVGRSGLVVPLDPRIRGDVFVDPPPGARPGDVVVARIVRYATRHEAMQGEVAEVLGPPSDPGVLVEAVIREHALRTEFPREVEEQASAMRLDVPQALSEPRREDVRERFTVTIDPPDARDHDDAISIERVKGGWSLGVHIADVSHYVPWGSAVDNEARARATSVYLVDRVLPMLPEALSNGLCSLRPGEDRLAFSVDLEVDRNGAITSARAYRSVIRSDRRLDYDSVQSWFDAGEGFPDAETRDLLGHLRDVTAKLGERRFARGGLDFETVEPKVLLDGEGRPLEVVLRRRTTATNMIEEAMIAANEAVARMMRDAGAPMVFRIHEDPDAEALSQVGAILREFDYPVRDVLDVTPATFQRIVEHARGRDEELLVNSLLLRALERARYSDQLGSHFGLASEAYTHFTSPIRRYPDLLVHRLLAAMLAGELEREPVTSIAPELEWLTDHCSVMEREAEHAEEDSVRVKLCELLADRIGEEFPGIVTGVQSFGFFVQLESTAEGLVHVSSLADDHYRLEPERHMLVGESTGRKHRLGDRVLVRLVNVSVAGRRIDLELA